MARICRCTSILLFLLFWAGGCGVSPTSPGASGSYTLSGFVRVGNFAQMPLENAKVQILDGPRAGAFALSDAAGAYSISGLPAGKVKVRASKDGFQEDPEDFPGKDPNWWYGINGNTTIDFSLPLLPRSISIGEVISGSTSRDDTAPYCTDEVDPDADRVPCERFILAAAADGTLTVRLTWSAPQTRLLLVVSLPRGGFVNPQGASPLTASVGVQAGARYHIDVWDYPGGFSGNTFELRTEFQSR